MQRVIYRDQTSKSVAKSFKQLRTRSFSHFPETCFSQKSLAVRLKFCDKLFANLGMWLINLSQVLVADISRPGKSWYVEPFRVIKNHGKDPIQVYFDHIPVNQPKLLAKKQKQLKNILLSLPPSMFLHASYA